MSIIVFYSNRCIHCKNFLDYFRNTQEYVKCNFICVDKNESGQRNPYVRKLNIKRVPSVIIENDLLEGIHAFDWLKNLLDLQTNANSRVIGNDRGYKHVDNKQQEIVPGGGDLESKSDINYKIIGDPNDTRIVTPEADDIINEKTGEVVFSGSSSKKKRRNKNDSLKSKQYENDFHKLKEERDNALTDILHTNRL